MLHALLDTKYNTPTAFRLADYSTSLQVSGSYTFNSCDTTLPLLAGSDSVVTGWSSVLVSLAENCLGANPLMPHRLALALSFRTTTPTSCLPPFYGRRLLSLLTRVNPNPSLFRWTIAGGSLWETCLWVHYCTYPYMDAKPPILQFLLLVFLFRFVKFNITQQNT